MDGKFIIENFLKQGQSERLEFKPKAIEDQLARNVTAMLNGTGGDIVIGIDDENNIIGVADDDVKGLHKALVSRIRPTAPIDIHSIDYDGKKVLLISVWKGAQKPYHCDGKIYQKEGYDSIIADSDSISNMLSDRKESDFKWERMPVLGAEMEDLDLDEVRNTMKEYAQIGNESIPDEELFLMRNGLLKDGNLTNACIALYAKNPVQFIAQTRIKLSVYTSDSAADLVETRLFESNIFKNVDAIFQFIDMSYSKSVRVEGLLRTEQWNYPRIAVREGIMNAIVHRDYNSINGFMQISLYPKRLEIVSYGILPSMVPVVARGGEGYSMLRNTDIAHQCYYRRLIEMMGTGIPRMIQDSKKHGFDVPEFEIKDQIVRVSFPNISCLRTENYQQVDKETSMKAHFEGVIEGAIEGVRKEIKEKMIAILFVLNEQPGCRTTLLEERTNIPAKSIERYIKILKKAGLISFSGPSKSGGYFLSDSVLRE